MYVRIRLHPHIAAFRGQSEGWGCYFPNNHSPEDIGRTLADARKRAQAMLLALR